MVSSRATLLVVNVCFFFIGAGIMSIGLWAQYDKNFSVLWDSSEVAKFVEARSLNGASILLIISGLASIIISFMGLYGALQKDRCFLTTYCLFMSVIIILEVSAAAIFISYQHQPIEKLHKGLNDTVQALNADPNDKVAFNVMETVQTVFKCCGCDGPSDYLNITMMTSCRTDNYLPLFPDYYQVGCTQAIIAYINTHLPIIFGLAIAMVLFQLFCLMISFRACNAIKYEGYDDI